MKKTSSTKINFSKSQTLWAGAYKNRIDKPEQILWSQFSIKILRVYSVIYVFDKYNWGKINKKSQIDKKSIKK